MRGESREQEALRRLNEATAEGFRRSFRGPRNITINIGDNAEGERQVDVDEDRPVQPRAKPLQRG